MRTSASACFCLGLASALVLAGAVGCDDDDFNDDLVNLAVDTGNARGEELAIMTDQELGPQPQAVTDAMAAMIVMTIDEGEIATAQAALPNLVDPSVIAFANRMIADHTANLEQLQSLVDRLGITPADTGVSAALRNDAEAAVRQISAAGGAVDVVYMRTQVELHSAALKVVDEADDHVDDGELDDFLSNTEDMISHHRRDAVDLLRDL
jgi:predicted outer membrane protein